jgi:hypothetical protein
MLMRTPWLTSVLLAALALPDPAAAQGGGFVGRETREIVEICAVGREHARYEEARAFCHGYLTGLYSAVLAARAPNAPPLHCNLPQSRQEGVDRFVAWARGNPATLAEFPPNSFLRFMDATYACPRR